MKYVMWLGIPIATFLIYAGITWAMVGENTRDISDISKILGEIKTQVYINQGYLISIKGDRRDYVRKGTRRDQRSE